MPMEVIPVSNDKRGFKWGVILGLAFLGFSMSTGWALNKGYSFKLIEHSYTNSPLVIGAILSLQGIIGSIVPILSGYYSDKHFSPRGRRKPFILAGGLMAALATALIYIVYVNHLSLAAFTIALAFFFFAMYFYSPIYRSLMPDVIPSGERGNASGIITLFEWMGNLVLFGLIAILAAKASGLYPNAADEIAAMMKANFFMIPFAMVGVLLLGSALYVYFRIEEPELKKTELHDIPLGRYLREVFSDKEFLSFYFAQILFWLSFEFVAVFMMGILKSVLGTQKVTAIGNAIMALFNVTVLVGAVVGGPLYEKFNRRKTILIGGIIFLIPFMLGWFVNTKTEITVLMALGGIGWGIFVAASWPVIGDLLSKYEREELNGLYYGIFEAVKSLPVFIAAIVGGVVVYLTGGTSFSSANFNYKVLFPIGAMFVAIALPLIWNMKHLDVVSKDKPGVEDLETTETEV